jgi:hypothetical protein
LKAEIQFSLSIEGVRKKKGDSGRITHCTASFEKNGIAVIIMSQKGQVT